MADLHCSEHEVPLVFSPERSEWVCEIPPDTGDKACTIITLADILAAIGPIVGYVELPICL